MDGSDSGNSVDPCDSTDDDFTPDQENDTTKETMKDTQTSTMAVAGTPTTTKHTRSHFERRQDPQDVDCRNFLDGSDTGNSADPHDSTDDDFTQDQENDITTETMKDTQTSTTALAGTPPPTKCTRSHFARNQDQENDTTKQTMKDTQTSTTALAGTPTTTNHTRSHFARFQDQENDTTKETMKDTQTSTPALAGTPTTTKRTRSHFARRQDPQDIDVWNFLDGSDSGNSADPHDSTDDDFTADLRDSSDDDVTDYGRRSTNNNNKCVRTVHNLPQALDDSKSGTTIAGKRFVTTTSLQCCWCSSLSSGSLEKTKIMSDAYSQSLC